MTLNDDIAYIRNNAIEYGQLDGSYFFARMDTADTARQDPIKLDGIMMFKVNKGSFKIEFNLETHEFRANSMFVFPYGSLIKPIADEAGNEVEFIFFHKEFLQNLNINFSAISTPLFIGRQDSDIILTREEAMLVDRYITLLKENTRSQIDIQIAKNIGSSVLAALIYQMVGLLYKRVNNNSAKKGQRSSRLAYVHDFIKLVHVHYTQERSVAFYAEKLFISPKYLSLLVKEATGKSAARWIDEFVIMEAKNLLRFSGKNVQQVAYSLNFSNQSSFGKYFKHLTGLSPTEYQKT